MTNYLIKVNKAGFGNQLLNTVSALTELEQKAENCTFCTKNIFINTLIKNSQFQKKYKYFTGKLQLSECLINLDRHIIIKHFHFTNETKRKNRIAVHFRGGDFKVWKPHSVMNKDFFLNSLYDTGIDLFTDDRNSSEYRSIKKSIKDNYIDVREFKGSMFSDFLNLCRYEKIIASPSTFSLCAAMLSGAEIVFSKQYAETEMKLGSSFWTNVLCDKVSGVKVLLA